MKMNINDNVLYNEILEEPIVLNKILQEYIDNKSPALEEAVGLLRKSPLIIFTGMATSMYACMPAQCILSEGGIQSHLWDTSEFLHYHIDMVPKNATFILVSQSGESAEIVHLLESIHNRWPVIGIYNNPNSTLAKMSTIGIPILAGPQLACGSKTNTATIAVMNILVEALLNHDLTKPRNEIQKAIGTLNNIFKEWETSFPPYIDFFRDSTYSVFVGRGPGLASAMFSAVLFREVPKVVAEGMAAATFRHGLREMITPEHRLIIFAPKGKTTHYLYNLATDMAALDIPVLIFTNQTNKLSDLKKCLVFQSEEMDEFYSPLVDITPPQLIGVKLAIQRGLEPGKLIISNYITQVE